MASEDTRARLIAAAERLLAERGVEGPSLREITRASGARNAVALQYHFGDRDGLVDAILRKHLPLVDARRHALLDELDARGDLGLRALAAALVRPFAAELEDPDGGPEFIQIYAEVVARTRTPVTPVGMPSSLERWRRLVEPHLSEDATRLHRRYTAIAHSVSELASRAKTGPHTDDRLFTSYLIDVITAVLSAPVSDETTRLADERDLARA
jgi:AcrR family transcriptional regulator